MSRQSRCKLLSCVKAMSSSQETKMQIHGFYGTGCTDDPAVTCEVGSQSGTCLRQMIDTRVNQATDMSLAIGDKCINITRDYRTLYVDMPGEKLMTTECDSELVNFYDVMHCMVPDKIPKRPY